MADFSKRNLKGERVVSASGVARPATHCTRFMLLLAVSCSVLYAGKARAQHDAAVEDRFSVSIGAYEQINYQTRIRVDALDFGIGAVLDLEDSLNVADSTGPVFRLDGHYRFNRAHRIDLTWYSAERTGFIEIFDEQFDIGDLVFRFGSSIESAIEFGVLKVGYGWSFVNAPTHEFYVGAGLNFYKDRIHFRTRVYSGQDVEVDDYKESGKSPLPTASFGIRYHVTGKWSVSWDYEVVAIELGDFSGRLQESVLGVEHQTWDHIGFGLGLTHAGDFVETDEAGNAGEFDSSYQGWRLYLKTRF